jgi:hypothetical protein
MNAMMAEVALLDDGDQGIDVPRIVRTGGETVLATDASMFIDDDDAIFPFPGRLDRTVDHARRVVTLIAEGGEKVPRRVRILPLFDNLHPGTEHPQGNMVFCLAGDGTAMATDTPSKIDHHRIPLLVHPVLRFLHGNAVYT